MIALACMPSPKAAAAEWSYGIKEGVTNSFCGLAPKTKESGIKKVYQNGGQNVVINSSIWNPWFGAALYMQCDFNDHIGLGTELLYNRFDFLVKIECDTMQGKKQLNAGISIHTIGLPLLLIWNWTAAIRPDFKEDYFLGRFFAGFHSFLCISRSDTETDGNGNGILKHIPYDRFKDRLKFGFIGGTSFEFPSGLLLELKGMLPYNLLNQENKEDRSFIASIHLSVGYNLAKLY